MSSSRNGHYQTRDRGEGGGGGAGERERGGTRGIWAGGRNRGSYDSFYYFVNA